MTSFYRKVSILQIDLSQITWTVFRNSIYQIVYAGNDVFNRLTPLFKQTKIKNYPDITARFRHYMAGLQVID